MILGAISKGPAYSFLFGDHEQVVLPYTLYTSAEIMLEVQRKLEEKFHFKREQTAKFMSDFLAVSELVIPSTKLQVVRDEDDNKILECALEAGADLIITYDKDLLNIKQYNEIHIIHPRMIKHWFLNK